MKIGALVREIRDRFRDKGLETADLDARLLVADALDMDVSAVILHADDEASEDACGKARVHCEKRLSGMPVGRILGRREFWGLELGLNAETLEPRPDTETLVEAVLARTPRDAAFAFADIGTGTGAIAIALLSERANAFGLAVDISGTALTCAAENAARLGVGRRLLCVQGDYCAALGSGFDWIVSNPPYIRTAVIEGLGAEVREHDPRRALDGGGDGLDAYRSIVEQSASCLNVNGRIALEIGFDQAESVASLLGEYGFFDIEIIHDLAGNDRVLVAKRNKIRPF
ncbi:peptide chain release factor N(5)-glutamine methyltransferase [Roseibium aggregatum]|uniref:Release factor glutamine methyltransferase n=1 Tax=Roseibium aggregatum TaxID=187304 RepID=A0A926S880_9HYPH|nr:peptide chain release factor N(5)-glutamine methyltransferase [Roseibium aggregatum]MBD1549175.1 peptide chain release factor N(5)-glutamine methyltransferase [Roseibium aggregatum]